MAPIERVPGATLSGSLEQKGPIFQTKANALLDTLRLLSGNLRELECAAERLHNPVVAAVRENPAEDHGRSNPLSLSAHLDIAIEEARGLVKWSGELAQRFNTLV